MEGENKGTYKKGRNITKKGILGRGKERKEARKQARKMGRKEGRKGRGASKRGKT